MLYNYVIRSTSDKSKIRYIEDNTPEKNSEFVFCQPNGDDLTSKRKEAFDKAKAMVIKMKKGISNTIRVVLVLLILSLLAICVLWVPDAIEYIEEIVKANQNAYGESLRIVLCTAVALISLPLLAVFSMAFVFPSAIESDRIFTHGTACLLRVIALILFGDCALFGAGVLWLFVVGERLLSPAFAFVCVIGLTVAFMLLVLSGYVNRAATLKEEADFTL